MTTEHQPTATPDAAPATAGAASAEPKSKEPFAAAAKVVRSVQLIAVRFSACSAQLLESIDVIPDEVDLSVSIKFLTPTILPVNDGFSTKTTLLFQMGGKHGEGSPKPYAVVRATLEARYDLKPDTPRFSDGDLRDFALCYCPFHVWGYWREFVQSSLARLDLPQITVPLFLIVQAPQMVRDKLD